MAPIIPISLSEKSIVSDLYMGQTRAILECLECGTVSKKDESFFELTIEIPDAEKRASLRQPTQPSSINCRNTRHGADDATYAVFIDATSIMRAIAGYATSTWLGQSINEMTETPQLSECVDAYCSPETMSGENTVQCDKCGRRQKAR